MSLTLSGRTPSRIIPTVLGFPIRLLSPGRPDALFVFGQPPLGIKSRHTPCTGSRNSLTIIVISYITSRKDTLNIRRCTEVVLPNNIFLGIQFQLPIQKCRIRCMTNCQKYASCGYYGFYTRLRCTLQPDTGYTIGIITKDFNEL